VKPKGRGAMAPRLHVKPKGRGAMGFAEPTLARRRRARQGGVRALTPRLFAASV
jgi:hypothetical protein